MTPPEGLTKSVRDADMDASGNSGRHVQLVRLARRATQAERILQLASGRPPELGRLEGSSGMLVIVHIRQPPHGLPVCRMGPDPLSLDLFCLWPVQPGDDPLGLGGRVPA
jgi:hypothetical protein